MQFVRRIRGRKSAVLCALIVIALALTVMGIKFAINYSQNGVACKALPINAARQLVEAPDLQEITRTDFRGGPHACMYSNGIRHVFIEIYPESESSRTWEYLQSTTDAQTLNVHSTDLQGWEIVGYTPTLNELYLHHGTTSVWIQMDPYEEQAGLRAAQIVRKHV